MFYRINDSSPILFFSGVHVSEPLWALIDVYGLTRGVQLLGESCIQRQVYVLLSQIFYLLPKTFKTTHIPASSKFDLCSIYSCCNDIALAHETH